MLDKGVVSYIKLKVNTLYYTSNGIVTTGYICNSLVTNKTN